MTEPYQTFETAVVRLREGFDHVARTVGKAFRDEVEQLAYEFMTLTGRTPGSLGQVIRLRQSQRWAVAGRWLISDERILEPRTWRERLVAGMARDVAEGRLLADPGF